MDKMDALLQEMARLGDVDSCRDFVEQRNVDTRGCTTVQDFKDRVKHDWMKKNDQMKNLKAAHTVLRESYEQDVLRRVRLDTLYALLEGALEIVMVGNGVLRKHLETEKVITAGDYKSTIANFRQGLRQNQCCLVMAGETSCCKSHLMNLLLEDTVLPTQLAHSVTTTCEIVYGESLKATSVIRGDEGSVEERPFSYENREEYLCKKNERHDVGKQSVRMSIPQSFLKSGVTLVNTLDVDERSETEQALLDYVEHHPIYGFVYVIKDGGVGGMSTSRLQDLLLRLLKLQDENGHSKINPRTTIFVYDNSDMGPDKERLSFEQDVIAMLTTCWPGFDQNEQLFKLNTEFAFHSLEAGYITDDYAQLINGLQKLLPAGLKLKLKMPFGWLNNVLTRLYYPIRVYLNQAGQTNEQTLKKKLKEHVDKEVSRIREECDRFSADFDEIHKSKMELISRSLLEHLKSPAAAEALQKWGPGDVPVEEYGDSWPIIEEKIDDLIDRRIATIIGEWEQQNVLMESNHKRMLNFIGDLATSMADQIDELEKYIRCINPIDYENWRKNVRGQSTFWVKLVRKESMKIPEQLKNAEFFKGRCMKTLTADNVSLQRMTLQNAKEAVSRHLAFLMALRKKTRKQAAESMHKLYKEDGVKYVTTKAVLVFESIVKRDVVKQLVAMQFEGLVGYAKDVVLKKRAVLTANQELLKAVTKDAYKKLEVEVRNTYTPLEEVVRDLLNKSASFAYDAIKEYDASETTITLLTPSSRVKRILSVPLDGLFATYKVRLLNMEHGNDTVTVKTYLPRMCSFDKLQEEANLRLMMKKDQLTCVPRLLMVLQNEERLPALVFHEVLESARNRYMPQNQMATKVGRDYHFKDCHVLIESLCEALLWLHFKHLVHMEVSLDSVMVNVGGQVKLSNLGEARALQLEPSEVNGPTGSYVYMPPEVLNGECYSSASDVYSMGILVWELWHDQLVFTQEKLLSVREFRALENPFRQMTGTTPRHSYTDAVEHIVDNCMKLNAKERFNMREFEELWHKTMIHLNIVRS